MDPETGKTETLGRLFSDKGQNHYVSRGAVSSRGTMVFGKILTAPAGIYRARLQKLPAPQSASDYLRFWG
jgi:hypothetical protein